MYSNIQDRIDNLQNQIDLTQSYVKMISRDMSAPISKKPHKFAKFSKATPISSKQSLPPTDTAYLIQLPHTLLLAMIAELMSGLQHQIG